jgi:methyl-accepting chemotaxis protein
MSINRKLTALMLVICLVALTLLGTAMIAIEWISSRKTLVENMTVMADLLARYGTAPLSFHRDEDIEELNKTLEAVQADPNVLAVCIYDKNEKRFGEYVRPGNARTFPAAPPAEGHRFTDSFLELSYPIERDKNRIGTVFLRANMSKIYDQITLYVGIVALVLTITIGTVFVLSFRLRRIVTAPILALANVAKFVTEKKDYSARAQAQSQDEVGALTAAFNQMLGEIEMRQSSLQKANRSLQEQASEIAESIHVLTSSSQEILSTSMELAAGAAQTATSIRETTAVMDGVRQTTQATNESAKVVAQGAQTVVEISMSGKESVAKTIHGMEHIQHQVGAIAESMVRLSEQTQAIGQILATVDDLAAQSNLLAINASIEAAKAGEHGKGFMVVAQEVRNLAEQSKQATGQVRNILGDIQKATTSAVMATEQGSKAVESGVKLSGQSGTTIESLSRSVTEAAQAALRIANSSQQQLAGTDQVASAMTSIEQTSTQNAISAKQLETAARNLKGLGEKLKQFLEK